MNELKQFFRYGDSIYGGPDILQGVSFDLLKWFFLAGVVVIVVHAAYKAVAGKKTEEIN